MPPDGKKETHESYGMVRAHRQTGKFDNLFGSSIQSHHTAIALEIVEAEVTHDLAHDWYYGSRIVTEVVMSPSQFAELITNMNTSGVPCTIKYRHTEGFKKIEDPPSKHVEAEKVKIGFKEDLEALVKTIKSSIAEANELMEGRKTPRKSDWNKLIGMLNRVQMEVESNMPFIVDSFNEATEKIVTTAKTEIDAFVTNVAQVTGIKALKEMSSAKLGGLDPSKAIEGKRCDHEFSDTNHCIKCGVSIEDLKAGTTL